MAARASRQLRLTAHEPTASVRVHAEVDRSIHDGIPSHLHWRPALTSPVKLYLLNGSQACRCRLVRGGGLSEQRRRTK